MKLLLDQGLPRSTVRHLADAGIVAQHIGDLGMSRVADDVILDAARQRGAVVVTLDADFSVVASQKPGNLYPTCNNSLPNFIRSFLPHPVA